MRTRAPSAVHSSRALRDGELSLLQAEGDALAYVRRDGADVFVCLSNAGEAALAWEVPLPGPVRSVEVVPLRSERGAEAAADLVDGRLRLSVPARHGAIVRLHPA